MSQKNQVKKTTGGLHLHLVKRDDISWWESWIIRAIAILLALVVSGALTVLITKIDPVKMYVTMVESAFGTPRRIWNLAQGTAILLCIALAVTPAFKMKFWNIGAEGQTLMGGFATAAFIIAYGSKLPDSLLIPITFVLSMLAGAFWAIIPAYFKTKLNANETLFTLMMNYIAIQILAYFTMEWAIPKNSNTARILHEGQLPPLFGQPYFINILVVVIVTVLMYIYLKYSKQGYEISVVGESVNTARYIGINVNKVTLRTMAISGAICGIAGFLLVSGTNHSVNQNSVNGRGYTAIMVSWLAKFNPIYMILTSLLIVFLQMGSLKIAEVHHLNPSFPDIITGIIIFFIIGSEFFINYKLKLKNKEEKVW